MKIYYNKELFKGKVGLCESVFCAPFENPDLFKEEKFENNRFEKLIKEGKKYLQFVSIEECDFVVIPYKWDNCSNTTQAIIDEARKFNKKILTLHNDDYAPQVRLSPNDGFLFTTTLVKNQNQENEFSFPAFTGDFFEKSNSFNISKRLGFCGGITHQIRYDVLNLIFNSDLDKDIIIRKGFWAPELSKDDAREQFINNMINNTFIICMRGAGNFSYRLYETMMMGRIPIIIDSNQVFPFEKKIDYSEFSFRIDHSNVFNIVSILKEFIRTLSDDKIKEMQTKSRQIWEDYMSPEGWIKNFNKEII